MKRIILLLLVTILGTACGNRIRKFVDQPSPVLSSDEIKKAIDPVYPVTTASPAPGYYNSDITITFQCDYNGTPCDSEYATYARSDGIAPTFVDKTSSLILTTSPGTRTIYTVRYFSAKTDGSNQEVVRSDTYFIDKEAPIITDVFPPTNTGYLTIQNVEILMNETGTIYYTLNDPNDGIADVDPKTLDPVADLSTLCPLPESGKLCPYSSKIPLTQSTNILYYAVDLAGNKSTTGLASYVIDTTGNGIGSSAEIVLNYENVSTNVTIKMTKTNLQALIANGYDMKVMDLDMGPVMNASLEKIKTATFSPGTPEQNMQNLLLMSAASADLSGTLLEDLISVTNYIGLEGGATGFLALTMNKGPTEEADPLLSTAQINDTMTANVLGIHYGTNNSRYFSGTYNADGTPIDYTDGKIWDFNFTTQTYCKRPWKHSCEDPAGAQEYPTEAMPAAGTFPIFLSDALNNMAGLAQDKTGMGRFTSGGTHDGQPYSGFMCTPPLHPLVVNGTSRGDGTSDAICLTCGSGSSRCEPVCGVLKNEPCAPQNCVYDPAWPTADPGYPVYCYDCGPNKDQPCPYSKVMQDTMYLTIPATISEDIRKGYDFTDLKVGNIDQVSSSAFNLDTTQMGVYGLVENATVDMIFTMNESSSFYDIVPAGEYSRNTGNPAGGDHRGFSDIWKNNASGGLFPENRFLLEYVVAYGAYKAVQGFTFAGSDYDYRSDVPVCNDSGFSGGGPYNFSTALRCYDDPGSGYTDPFRKYSGNALHKQYHNGDHTYKLAEIWQSYPTVNYYSNNAQQGSTYGCNVNIGGNGPWIQLWTVIYNNPPGGWFIDGQGGNASTCHDPQLLGFYLHDLINVVAQKRIHDGGLAEGLGNVRFKLEEVPVGLTADQMKQAIRDALGTPSGKDALLNVATVLFAGANNGIPDVFIDRDNNPDPNLANYYLCLNIDPVTKINRTDGSVVYTNVGLYRNDVTYPAFDPSSDFVPGNKKSTIVTYTSAKGGINNNECVLLSSGGGEVYWIEVEDGTDAGANPDVYKIEMLSSTATTGVNARFRWTRIF